MYIPPHHAHAGPGTPLQTDSNSLHTRYRRVTSSTSRNTAGGTRWSRSRRRLAEGTRDRRFGRDDFHDRLRRRTPCAHGRRRKKLLHSLRRAPRTARRFGRRGNRSESRGGLAAVGDQPTQGKARVSALRAQCPVLDQSEQPGRQRDTRICGHASGLTHLDLAMEDTGYASLFISLADVVLFGGRDNGTIIGDYKLGL